MITNLLLYIKVAVSNFSDTLFIFEITKTNTPLSWELRPQTHEHATGPSPIKSGHAPYWYLAGSVFWCTFNSVSQKPLTSALSLLSFERAITSCFLCVSLQTVSTTVIAGVWLLFLPSVMVRKQTEKVSLIMCAFHPKLKENNLNFFKEFFPHF